MERTMLADAASLSGRSAIVLGGGGVFGATQVGMLRALLESGFEPDLVIGTSVGALNGAAIAANPTTAGVDVLADLWGSLGEEGLFTETVLARASTLARYRTHLYSPAPLRKLLASHLPATFEDLTIPFQCVAASIERAVAHWFSAGSLTDAVMASCAVPGLLPPVVIDGEHFLDGGLVHSIPIGRALALGGYRDLRASCGPHRAAADRAALALGRVPDLLRGRAAAPVRRGDVQPAARGPSPRAAER